MIEFYVVLGLFWFFGWCSQVAAVETTIKRHESEFSDIEKSKKARVCVAIMLLFLWPYVYFYGR